MKTAISLLGAALLVLGLVGCATEEPEETGEKEITIWWAQWAPADGLQELGREFQKETGIEVVVHQIPWSSYQDQVFLNFGNNQTDFDIVVGDSQWIGRGATKKLYLDLTDWLPEAVDISTIHPRALRYLCEYPGGSGRYFAAPCETDAVGFAYRKDWFEDPAEMAAFQEKYGRALAVPETWTEFKEVAEFFTRPEEKVYGCALLTGRGYDSLTMGFQVLMWGWGGSWGDEKTFRVDGYANGEESMQALQFMKELVALAPPGGTNIDYGKSLDAFMSGSTAMSMNYFAFYPGIAAEMGDKAGFFKAPGHGQTRVTSLGGQGFSISTKVSSRQQKLAKQFIAWFLQEKIQRQWVQKPAGFTANTAILSSEAFAGATAYNRPFAESMDLVRDFWNVPVYNELLSVAQRQLGEALDGRRSPQEALDALAASHERIFSQAWLLQ